MKTSLQMVFCLLIVISLVYCAPQEDIKTIFPQKIKSVYFQKWIGGKEPKEVGTNFYIEFGAPLSQDIQLVKIYFQNQEADLEQSGKSAFVAHLVPNHTNPDLILHKDSLKEYGNQAPVITKLKFVLKPTEALLEYKSRGKIYFFKISNPKVMPMIVYPSVIKPKK